MRTITDLNLLKLANCLAEMAMSDRDEATKATSEIDKAWLRGRAEAQGEVAQYLFGLMSAEFNAGHAK